MSDIVAGAALVTSLFGLAVMWRQLRVARGPFGRGLVIGALPAAGIVQVVNGVEQPREFEFTIRSHGPGTYFDISGAVQTADGGRHWVIQSIPRMDNTSGTKSGTLALTTEEARSAWFVVTWLAANRDGIRTEGYRLRVLCTEPRGRLALPRSKASLQDDGDGDAYGGTSKRPLQVFRWDWTGRVRNRAWMRLRRWVPAWVRRAVPKQLAERFQRSGRWRQVPPSVPVRGIWADLKDPGRWY